MRRMNEIPLYPSLDWFSPPTDMPRDTGCVVEPNGRVYGYLTHWGSILMDGSTDRWTPPRSKTSYAYAHTGDTILDTGAILKTANLGGDFGHAPIGAGNLEDTQKFYENTQTQLARVRYGEDEYGIWFAGACWPTVSELDMAKLRASARSGHWCALGDWRDINSGRHGYELVGACLVNVPGLKYARADKAASGVLSFNPLAWSAQEDSSMGVSGASDIQLLNDRNAAWDGPAAEQRIQQWASSDGSGAKETIDWSKYASVFFWKDPANLANFGGYKLLFADVVDGEVNAVWRGVATDAAIMQGSRGGVDMPDADRADVKTRIGGYYDRFAQLFDDASIVAPWDQTTAGTERVAASGTIELAPAASSTSVGGILVVEGTATEDGRLISPNATEWRDLPLPLYASLENLPGHSEANLVGRIDTIERDATDPTIINYAGVVFPASAGGAGQEVIDAIGNQQLRGVSIDGIVGPDDAHLDANNVEVMDRIVIAGATLVPMPAISQATVTLMQTDSTEGQFKMSDATNVDEAAAPDANAPAADATPEDVATNDIETAISDQVASVADRVEYLIGLVEQSQMSARLAAVDKRLGS